MIASQASGWLSVGLLVGVASAFFQHPFGTQQPELSRKGLANFRSKPAASPSIHHTYGDRLFAPMERPSALSETDFTLISHPLFPDVGVRIKKTKFCDPTVK
jgi:hypothetical protein